jgi:adenine phosphoribosyltransferase
MTVDGDLTRRLVDALALNLPDGTEAIVGVDIGGLGFAGALAWRGGLGLVDARKVGSIPVEVIRGIMANYELGDGIAISKSSRIAGRRVAVVDDCLMSGGTALATVRLLRRLGAVCTAALFVFELEGMGGRERLEQEGVRVHALGRLPRSDPEAGPADIADTA